jgi:hypothetical protein
MVYTLVGTGCQLAGKDLLADIHTNRFEFAFKNMQAVALAR